MTVPRIKSKAIVCSLRGIQLLFSTNDSGKGSRMGQIIIRIHPIAIAYRALLLPFFWDIRYRRSYANTTNIMTIYMETICTNNMIPVCICIFMYFQCIYMFVLHTMRPFDASRPGTLSADELRKQSEMAKMVPCHILSSLSSLSEICRCE